MSAPTLAVRIYEALAGEDSPWNELIDVTDLPPEAVSDKRGELASEIGLGHLLTWAFLYGGAYAAARIDNPLGSDGSWIPVHLL